MSLDISAMLKQIDEYCQSLASRITELESELESMRLRTAELEETVEQFKTVEKQVNSTWRRIFGTK